MSYREMYLELGGAVPKVPFPYRKTIINRAWRDVRRQSLWSFLLFEANWFTPSVINVGAATVTQGASTVVFDAAAAALINAVTLVPSPITARQFRVGVGTIYNIWAWDGASTATLDRPYAEASATDAPYAIFQCYYPAPMQDFKTFLTVRDPASGRSLITTRNRDWVDERDPQRQNYQPTHVVFVGSDQNPNSSTYGWPLFELWGQPQSQAGYTIYGVRKGVDLVRDSETLPAAIGEDVVMALARSYAYEWAEANKGENARMIGPDFRYLMEKSQAEYRRLFREYRKEDRELVDNWVATRRSDSLRGALSSYYNAVAGVASAGGD